MNSKIRNDINELVAEQVISKETASKIESYYISKYERAPNKLFTVFAILGSALVGLGIILILAHNWDNFSRAIKTSFAFLPLIMGQLLVGYSILKRKSATWKEASGVFLFFSVGASLALVSQIYNIPGDLSSYLLTWTLLCLPLIYILKSNVLGILHIVFSTYYAVEHGYFYGHIGTPWCYALLLLAVMPHYYNCLKYNANNNITSIFNWFVPLSVIIVLGAFVNTNGYLGYLMYMLLFGLLYNIGQLSYFDNKKLRQNGYLVLGSLGTVYLLIFASFKWFWSEIIIKENIINSQEFYISFGLFLVTLSVLIYSYLKKGKREVNLFRYVFIIFSLLFVIGLSGFDFPVVFINILVLLLGVMAIKIGSDRLHFGVLNYGLLIIATLIVCRFFDTNISFVVRGLLFVGVGVGFFLTNYMMLKKRKSIKH